VPVSAQHLHPAVRVAERLTRSTGLRPKSSEGGWLPERVENITTTALC